MRIEGILQIFFKKIAHLLHMCFFFCTFAVDITLIRNYIITKI